MRIATALLAVLLFIPTSALAGMKIQLTKARNSSCPDWTCSGRQI